MTRLKEEANVLVGQVILGCLKRQYQQFLLWF